MWLSHLWSYKWCFYESIKWTSLYALNKKVLKVCTSRIDEDAKQGFLPCCLYQSFDTCHLDALIVASLVKIDIRYILFFFCIVNCNEIIWSCFHTTYSCLGGNIHENVGDLVLHIKIRVFKHRKQQKCDIEWLIGRKWLFIFTLVPILNSLQKNLE